MPASPLAMPVLLLRNRAGSEGKLVEQRRSQRFELKLPVLAVRAGTKAVCTIGETLNIGAGGVLMMMRSPLVAGDYIEFVIMLSAPAEATHSLRLNCKGRVLRGERFVYAATIDRYEFIRDDPTGS